MNTKNRITEIIELAARHGLAIDGAKISLNEAGLDYQVAFATDDDGQDWVLRIPRRADVSAKIADEGRILDLVKRALSVAVPDWQVQTEELIAYPTLPGEPGLTLSDSGEPLWHFDRESPVYARSFGRVVAELHSIDPGEARASGIPIQSRADVRQDWEGKLRTVADNFTIAPSLRAAWDDWLEDEDLWPEFTTFTHGELYPAHLLLDDGGGIRSVLDWTTAQVGDPIVDFMIHHSVSSPETFQLTVDAYAEITGRIPERLAERCTATMAAWPLGYAVFALTTGDPEHAAAASAGLNPPQG